MNKKVSTLLTVGLMLGGSLLSSSAFGQSNAQALNLSVMPTTDAVKALLNEWYYVGDGTNYLQLDEITNTANKNKYTSIKHATMDEAISAGDAALFKIEMENVGGKACFKLINKKTGNFVVFNPGNPYSKTSSKLIAAGDAATLVANYYSTITGANFTATGNTMVPYYGGNTDANTNGIDADQDPVSLGTSSTLKFYKVDINSISSEADIKEIFGSQEGAFSFEYKIGDVAPDHNFFDQDLRAIWVSNSGEQYVSGVYFVVNAPSDLKSTYDASDATDRASLNKLTFVAVDPSETWSINKLTGTAESMKFTTVRGSNIVENGNAEANDIVGANVAFTVETTLTKGDNVRLSISPRVNDDKNENLEPATTVYVAAVEDKDEIHVTTVDDSKVNDYTTWTAIGSANIVKVSDFLDTDDALVYNILFTSKVNNTGDVDGLDADDYEAKPSTYSEYNKYLSVAYTDEYEVVAQGKKYVDLAAPQNQWIVTNADPKENTVEFTNRETADKFIARLVKTSKSDEYRLAWVDENEVKEFNYAFENNSGDKVYAFDNASSSKAALSQTVVKLIPASVNKFAGYVSDEFDNVGLVKMSFSAETAINPVELFVTGEDGNEALNKDESKAASFEVIKFAEKNDTIVKYNNYAYWDASKKEVKIQKDADTIAVVSYAFKQFGNNIVNTYLAGDMSVEAGITDVADAQKFIVKVNADGSYSLVKYSRGDFESVMTNRTNAKVANLANGSIAEANVYSDFTSYFTIKAEELGNSWNHVPQHVTFKDANIGGYIAVGEEGNGIVAPVSELKADYTKEDLTFWLDTTNTDAHVPAFYISKAGKFMYNSADSAFYFDEATGTDKVNKDLLLPDTEDPRAIFRTATLKDENTLVTKIDGEDTELTVENGLNDYKFNIVENGDGDYVVRSLRGSYLYNLNGQLGFSNIKKAMAVVVETAEAPTSNEGVSATEVKVVAQDGAVVVKNAAGKNVVVSTILGQVVANEVLTSDNATINVPAGIVVVAVEGESFKVNVK